MASFVDPNRAKAFECAICLKIYKDPVQLSCEEHIYCSGCVNNLISRGRRQSFKCPLCRKQCSVNNVTRVRFIDRQINELKVYCPNSKLVHAEDAAADDKENSLQRSKQSDNINSNELQLGKKRKRSFGDALDTNSNNKRRKLNNEEYCEWIGCYSDLRDHIKSCPLHSVSCEYCNVSMKRKELSNHYYECQSFPVQCNECKETNIMRSEMENHIKNECPMTFIECTQCQKRIKRKDECKHLKNVCPEAYIECVFRPFGCMHKLKRKNEKEHVENAAITHCHLVQIANHQTKLSKQVKTLKAENKKLSEKISKQQKDFSLLTKEVKAIKSLMNTRIDAVMERSEDLEFQYEEFEMRMDQIESDIPKEWNNFKIAYIGTDRDEARGYGKFQFRKIYHYEQETNSVVAHGRLRS